MKQPQMDEEGYPTAATLRALRRWPSPDPSGVLDFLAAAWHYPDFGVSRKLRPCEARVLHAKRGERFLRLATGGWSGNEDLIAAFEKNQNYFFTWRLSACGGLHIFEYLQMESEAKR